MLIALTGASRAGKDSTAHILVDKYGFEQVALATAIRNILLDLNLDINGDGLRYIHQECGGDWDVIKAKYPESVDFMIRLGQSCRDNIGIDVWLRAALDSYDPSKNVVVSDCRQPNEVEWVRSHGGLLWRVTRPGAEQIRAMDNLLDGIEFDAVIVNDGTLDDLAAKVGRLM